MRNAVMTRLAALGHTVGETELEQLDQAIELAREEICAAINSDAVPDGLHGVFTERACLYFLRTLGITTAKFGEVRITLRDTLPSLARYRRMVW